MHTHHENNIQQYNDDSAHAAEETHQEPVWDSANYTHSYYTYTQRGAAEQIAIKLKLMFKILEYYNFVIAIEILFIIFTFSS